MIPELTERELHRLLDERPVGKTQVLVLAICFLLQIIDGFDVLAMSFAAPLLADEWQHCLSPTTVGAAYSLPVAS